MQRTFPENWAQWLPWRLLAPAGFVSDQCLAVLDHRADYIVVTMYEPNFGDVLSQWAQVSLLDKDTVTGDATPRYTVFAAEPDWGRLHPAALPVVRFDNWLEIRLLKPFSETVKAGDGLPVVLDIQPSKRPEIYPSVFVPLYGHPTPYLGGKLWAQADSEVCTSYAAPLWDPAETIIQTFPLRLPPDLSPGEYTVALGAYPAPAGQRRAVTTPPAAPNYAILYQFKISP